MAEWIRTTDPNTWCTDGYEAHHIGCVRGGGQIYAYLAALYFKDQVGQLWNIDSSAAMGGTIDGALQRCIRLFDKDAITPAIEPDGWKD